MHQAVDPLKGLILRVELLFKDSLGVQATQRADAVVVPRAREHPSREGVFLIFGEYGRAAGLAFWPHLLKAAVAIRVAPVLNELLAASEDALDARAAVPCDRKLNGEQPITLDDVAFVVDELADETGVVGMS